MADVLQCALSSDPCWHTDFRVTLDYLDVTACADHSSCPVVDPFLDHAQEVFIRHAALSTEEEVGVIYRHCRREFDDLQSDG